MKKYLLFIAISVSLASCAGNEEEKKEARKDGLLPTDLVSNPYTAKGVDTGSYNNLPTMDFTDTVHDFKTIAEGEKALYDFEFTNNGKTPLIISTAKGSCGCAIADFSKDPVPPGGKGTINVVFNSQGKLGHQEKSVAVTTNTSRSVHMLYIKADVISSTQ